MGRRAYTDEQRAEALATYVAEGLAEAHHRHGVPRSTLRTWATDAGHDVRELSAHASEKTREANEAVRLRWESLRATLADGAATTAAQILEIIGDHLDELEPTTVRDLKDLATVAGILVDKAQLLTGAATSRTQSMPWSRDEVVADAQARAEGLRVIEGTG